MAARKSYHHSKGRVCSACPTAIRNSNVSGLCRPCWLKASVDDADFQHRRAEGIRRKLRDDPAHAARVSANMRRVAIAAAKDPEVRQRRIERGHFMYENFLKLPEVRAKIAATRPAVAKKLSEQKLAWCPAHLRDEYLFLVKRKRVKASEARRIIMDLHQREEAKLTPFERQLRALENGGTLVEMGARPSLDRPGVYRP